MQSIQFEQQCFCPSKIVCVGRNYTAHIEELGNAVPDDMVLFLKPNSAIGDTLKIPCQQLVHYETELCFLIIGGQLAAIGLGIDLTLRDLQFRLKEQGLPWERAKSFDGAAVFSEFVPLQGSIDGYRLELDIDGELKQAGGVAQMLHTPSAILDEVQNFLSLEDGDILMTGTPAGVGALHVGMQLDARLYAGSKKLVTHRWCVESA